MCVCMRVLKAEYLLAWIISLRQISPYKKDTYRRCIVKLTTMDHVNETFSKIYYRDWLSCIAANGAHLPLLHGILFVTGQRLIYFG